MYKLIIDGGNFIQGVDVSSVVEGIFRGKDIMLSWMEEELRSMSSTPTKEEIEKWNYMIDSCTIWVEDSDGECYYLSDEDCDEIGWEYWENKSEADSPRG